MAREESYKDFLGFLTFLRKAGISIRGFRQTVKRHEKNAGQNDEILSAFFWICVRYQEAFCANSVLTSSSYGVRSFSSPASSRMS